MCAQHVHDQIHVADIADAQEDDRPIAGDTEAPEPLLSLAVPGHRRPGRPVARIGVEDRAGQTAVDLGLGLGDIQLAHDDLAVRPGHVEGAVDKMAVAVLLGQRQGRLAARGRPADQEDLQRLGLAQCDRLAHGGDRVEHEACRVGERREGAGRRLQRQGIGRRAVAPDEAGAVGLATRAPAQARHAELLEVPDLGFVRFAATACAEHGLAAGEDLRLDEEITEDAVREIGCGRGEHDLRVGRQFQPPRGVAAVVERDAADFDVVLGRDADFRLRLDREGRVTELGAPLREDGFVRGAAAEHGLKGAGPDGVGVDVAQIEEDAPVVAGDILAPARERQSVPAA